MNESRVPPSGAVPEGLKLLDRLFHENLLDEGAYQRVLHHAKRVGERIEDAIVATGVMTEQELLRYLASIYRTRFVSTRKLARANIDAATLQLVPRKVAARLLACPILFDRRSMTLSVVAANLEAHDVAKQIQMVSNVREVRVFVALPGAIGALLSKYYDGVKSAFEAAYEGSGLLSLDQGPGSGQAVPLPQDGTSFGDIDDRLSGSSAPPAQGLRPPSERTAARPAAAAAEGFTIEAPDIAASLTAEGAAQAKRTAPSAGSKPGGAAPAKTAASGRDGYLETLNVLVALLEHGRGELRGHSAHVARSCRKLCERMGLPEDETHGVLVAAYLHDIGKASAYHLTALNVATYEGHRVRAEKSYLTPVRMFEAAGLPDAAVQALTHQYERVDGEGFPGRLKGKDIPRGARILAIVETYADLTAHSKNPFRRVMSAKEACDALERLRDRVFDSDMLYAFRREVLGDDLKARLLSEKRTVLLVDPDPEETVVLEMRLVDQGCDVVIARDARNAIEHAGKRTVDLLITEVDLSPTDGFQLVERWQSDSEVPVLFLTRRGDRESVNRGLELGAVDYLVKPASAELVAAKAWQHLHGTARRKEGARGVSGSLTEMSLPDVIQILSNGRKSGQLTIRAQGKAGQLGFADGEIHDAHFGDSAGEEAIYAMLKLEEGDFELDPSRKPAQRSIHAPTESLLLEGMRRLDEGL